MRILVVDDEAYAADVLALLLRHAGHDVIVANDGASGIAVGVANRIDAAVIDLALGQIDGYDVAKALRTHHGADVRLIAYTGFSKSKVMQRAVANGFDGVIVKPATLERIVAAMSTRADDGS